MKARRLDEQGRSVAEALITVAQQMNDIGQNVKKLYGEMSENTRWVEGRLRLTNDRFDLILEAVDHEIRANSAADQKIEALARRVEALEQGRNPAA